METGWLAAGLVSIDTLKLVHQLAFWLPACIRGLPTLAIAASSPVRLPAHRRSCWSETRCPDHIPGPLCGRWPRACQGRAGWSVDGEGEKAAQRGQAGGVGGVQGPRARRASKQDMFRTSPGTCTHTLVRFGEGLRSPAPLFHAIWWRAPPFAAASSLSVAAPTAPE